MRKLENRKLEVHSSRVHTLADTLPFMRTPPISARSSKSNWGRVPIPSLAAHRR